MTSNSSRIFGQVKPVIAMVHLGASPGAPLFDSEAGLEGIVESARKDLKALQAAGFDAVMFGNENDRPYELKVDAASLATMAYVVGRLRANAHRRRQEERRREEHGCGGRTRTTRKPPCRSPAEVAEFTDANPVDEC